MYILKGNSLKFKIKSKERFLIYKENKFLQ